MVTYKGEKIDTSGKRIYLDENNKEYVSVTTLLSHYEDDTGLRLWAERIGEEEASRIKEEAALRGKATHSQIESFFEQKKDPSKIFSGEYNPYATAAIDKFYSKVTPLREEGVLLAEPIEGARLGGRFDQLLYLPPNTFRYSGTDEFVLGGNVIVDLKTKDKQPRLDKLDYLLKHLLQISTYATLLSDAEGIDIKGGCVVYAVALKTKNCCRVIHIDKESIKFYYNKVLGMLLDYYSITPMKQTWKDILKEASCTYDFIQDCFVSYEPREIY